MGGGRWLLMSMEWKVSSPLGMGMEPTGGGWGEERCGEMERQDEKEKRRRREGGNASEMQGEKRWRDRQKEEDSLYMYMYMPLYMKYEIHELSRIHCGPSHGTGFKD